MMKKKAREGEKKKKTKKGAANPGGVLSRSHGPPGAGPFVEHSMKPAEEVTSSPNRSGGSGKERGHEKGRSANGGGKGFH